MEAGAILNIVLTIALIALAGAGAVLLMQLAKTLKTTQEMLDETNKNLQPTIKNLEQLTDDVHPTLENVAQITKDLQPTIRQTGPMMERLNITVDSINLELMRVDQILANVTEISETASNAAGAVETVTAAPAKLVTGVSDKIIGALSAKKSSVASAALAEAAEERIEEKAQNEEETVPAQALPEKEPAHAKDSDDVLSKLDDSYFSYKGNADKAE